MTTTAIQSPKRGAIPSPRSVLAAATPHVAIAAAPPNYLVKPQQISMWGNDVHGDCVTAEEAFAKACNKPEIFIADAEVITWATQHGVLEGAYLTQVMQFMQSDGFRQNGSIDDDGPYFSVNWTDPAILQSAISTGPVKIGVAANQLETAWHSTGGHTGWFGTGFQRDTAEDHCVSLCGYGTLAWLAQQLGVQVPSGLNGSQQGYALFTWNSIGIIDVPSMVAITEEAWLRKPTTVIVMASATIAWGNSLQYDTGGPNAVALDDNGNAVEVHVGTNRLFYRVGKVDFASHTIAWGNSFQYDTGGPNAVALDNSGNAVEVHVGTNRLFYRVGKVDSANRTIAWGNSFQYDTGGPNAVALDNNGNAVDVHVGTNRLFYRVGKVNFAN